jgi:conjugative transfer pilus assembly protein TraH
MTSVPVYDTLKTARASKFQFSDDEISLIAELVAIDCAMRYTQDALQELSKSASNTAASGSIIAEFQGQVGKSLDAFGAFRNDAQEKYDHAVAALEKLQMAKEVLAAQGAAKFAVEVGQ